MRQNWFRLICLVSLILIYQDLFCSDKLDVLVIDPGHGGKDPGTIGVGSSKEKDINLSIALKFGQLVTSSFPTMKVILTRSTDDFIEVKDRAVFANSLNAKLFISIHCNHKKEEESDKNGFEIYVLNRERLPEAIEITVNEIKKLKKELYEVVNFHTSKSIEQIEKDFDRDKWMTAAEAKEYGLVDEVLLLNPKKQKKD